MGSVVAIILALVGTLAITEAPVRTDHAQQEAVNPTPGHLLPAQPQAKKKPPPAIDVQGIMGVDVSEYDEIVDWSKLTADKKFVLIRASHGSHHDATFEENWKAAKNLGTIRGVYHYVVPTDPYADQVLYFVDTVKLEPGDLQPVLDLEKPSLWKHMKPADRLPYILKWATALEHAYGVKPILYMSPSFIDDVLGGAQNVQVLKDYPLWVAHYKVTLPWVPLPWTSYIMWQYAEDAICDGIIHGPCDVNVAPGAAADLLAFTVQKAGGGDEKVLTKEDLNDAGLTAQLPPHFITHEDSQHGRHHKPRHHHFPLTTHHFGHHRHH